MIRSILVALADDQTSRAASQVAVALSQEFRARLTTLALVDHPRLRQAAVTASVGGGSSQCWTRRIDAQVWREVRRRLHVFESVTGDHDHASRWGEGRPWECIEAESRFHDLLVVGGDAEFSLSGRPPFAGRGEVLQRVVDHSVCPVLCVNRPAFDPRTVLVALDGRSASAIALQRFVSMALAPQARIVLLHCEGSQTPGGEFLKTAHRYLEAHQRTARVLCRRGPAMLLVPRIAAEIGADLVVLGPHGRQPVTPWSVGNTTLEMVGRSEVAVFVGQ